MWKKLTFFFDVFPVKRGAGHGRAGKHTNFQFFGLAPGGTIVPFTPAHSFARTHGTHARTAPQPKPKSISRFGYTPQPPIKGLNKALKGLIRGATYKTSLKADQEVAG